MLTPIERFSVNPKYFMSLESEIHSGSNVECVTEASNAFEAM